MLTAVSDQPPPTQSCDQKDSPHSNPGPGVKRQRKPRTMSGKCSENPASQPGEGGQSQKAKSRNVLSDIGPHKPPRQRKSRVAPPISLESVKENIASSSILKTPLTPHQQNVTWIQAGTLSGNILFGKAYIADRYKSIVDACALHVDIQQMQGGDLDEIAERGVNLSGGQRARVALARALYQDCETYLLDDPLSAVDAHVFFPGLLPDYYNTPPLFSEWMCVSHCSNRKIDLSERMSVSIQDFAYRLSKKSLQFPFNRKIVQPTTECSLVSGQ
ncbi:unnamed protein product [Calypogeia fissa]